MNKSRLVLIVAFLLVFAAGASVGLLVKRTTAPPQYPSWLSTELNLSPRQREQMGQIWSDVMGTAFSQQGQTRSSLQQEREKDILSLVPDEQRAKYELIQQYYTFKMDSLARERQRAFEQAVEQSKKILAPEQAEKYEELMRRQRERWASGGPGGFHGPHRHAPPPPGGPMSQPQSAPHDGDRD